MVNTCGRQPDGVWGAPPQPASPKLSFLPQWNHQVTSYMPSLGAMTLLKVTPPRPRSSCETFLPAEQHSRPSLIASVDMQVPAPQFPITLPPKSMLAGDSASYQPR